MTVSSLVAYRANSTASLVHGSKSCGYLSQTDPANIVEVVFDAPRGYRTPWNQLMQQLPKGTKQCSCITDILYRET